MAVPKRLIWRLLPRRERERLDNWIVDQKVRRAPDQRHMQSVLIPALARRGGRLLFVGCQRYTAAFPRALERGGVTCWTIDIDPESARWGSQARHVVAGIEQGRTAFPAASFETVVLSGVFGFGVDSLAGQAAVLDVCAALLVEGGLLVLGWDTDRVADPKALQELANSFRRPSAEIGLPHRTNFANCFHVFDLYERTIRPDVPEPQPPHDP